MHTSIIICNLYATAGETKESGGGTIIIVKTTARPNELITFVHNYFLRDEILDDCFCCSRSFFPVNYSVRYRIVTVFLLPRLSRRRSGRKKHSFVIARWLSPQKMLISIRSKSNLINLINHEIVLRTTRTSLMVFSFQLY